MSNCGSALQFLVSVAILISVSSDGSADDDPVTISVPQAVEIDVTEIPQAIVFSADKKMVYRSSGRAMIELPGFGVDESLTDDGQMAAELNALTGGKIDGAEPSLNMITVVLFTENAGVCTTCGEIIRDFLISLSDRMDTQIQVVTIEIDYKSVLDQ